MNEADTKHVAATEARLQMMGAIVELGIRLLSDKMLLVLAILLDSAIFAWAMYADSWPRIVGATLFAVASWCLIHLRPSQEHKDG
jgi:hypothetical protein